MRAIVLFFAVCGGGWPALSAAASRPNIVYILCDDLGYGDVACLNPKCQIATPNMDRLAREGMIFTDAHSGSSVCTPTRYGVMTGRYAWRTKLKSGVLGGLSPRLIEPGRLTVPALLRQHGYHTACIGKWHLGMDWVIRDGKRVSELSIESREQVFDVDYGQPIQNGPNAVGFDYYFGISASLDMVPYTYIEDDRVVALPTQDRDFELMLGRPGRRTRKGPAAPDFDAAQVLPDLAREATGYIEQQAARARADQPLFLYLPLASPHTPILPTPQWQGKSGLNPYGDFVMQTDWAIGQVLAALDQQGLAANTLVILTSDNGCSPQADFAALAQHGHHPSHVFRGHKADIFDGGHRVPFLVRWPGKAKAGTTSDQLLCLTDLFATCANLLEAPLPAESGEDSVSFLPTLLGMPDPSRREAVVHHSINGSFAIRHGTWKLNLCPDSGGWSSPRPGSQEAAGLPKAQLYDLVTDIGERNNVASQHPEIVSRLSNLLQGYKTAGRSTPLTSGRAAQSPQPASARGIREGRSSRRRTFPAKAGIQVRRLTGPRSARSARNLVAAASPSE